MLAASLPSRIEQNGARDPDSLHGLLIIAERGGQRLLQALLKIDRDELEATLESARTGKAGRTPSYGGSDQVHDRALDHPNGLLPLRWKRELVAGMLKPDGITSDEVAMVMAGSSHGYDPGNAVRVVRNDLRLYRISIEVERKPRANAFRYRIVGQDAWRMQKIIANGWQP